MVRVESRSKLVGADSGTVPALIAAIAVAELEIKSLVSPS